MSVCYKREGMAVMSPRDAIITIHRTRMVFAGMSVDGNTPNYDEVLEVEKVHAKVWPVAMSANEMLVEYDDGRLGAVKLRDIQLESI